LITTLTIALTSCSSNFEPFDYGKDACEYCKMTIVDPRFPAEIINSKGRVFKFDDIACMEHYIQQNKLKEKELKLFVASYTDRNTMLDAPKAMYVHDSHILSPMNGNTAAFIDQAHAEHISDSLKTTSITWNTLKL
jgi:copper chaperone NosL